jgi:hypothetical protein
MKTEKPIYYPDGFKFDFERLIFARFDGAQSSTATNVPIYFSNEDVFKNKVIVGIKVMLRGRNPGATATIQTDIGFLGTTIPDSQLKYFTLTLVGKNGDVLINDFPLINLNVQADNGKIRRFSCMIDLSKSYIRNLGATVPITTLTVIPLNFYYKNK